MSHKPTLHQRAQAMWSDGMAASSLALDARAPLCHAPQEWVTATTSTKPVLASRRGGATGYNQKTTKPITLLSTNVLRIGRYTDGWRHQSQPSSPSVTTKWASS